MSEFLQKAITRDKSPEEKEYLILGKLEDDTFFKICIGRSETYLYIKNHINEIDPYESYVIAEGLAIEKRINVYDFINFAKKQMDISDDFDINDYVIGDFNNEDDDNITVDTPDYMKVEDAAIDNFSSDGEDI